MWGKEQCNTRTKDGNSCLLTLYRINCRVTCKECCGDIWGPSYCKTQKGDCHKGNVARNCRKTCKKC